MPNMGEGSSLSLYSRIVLNSTTVAFDENTAATFAAFTPAAGERFIVFRMFLHFAGANTITFRSGANDISGAIPFDAGCYMSWGESGEIFVLKGAATSEAFNIVLASAQQVTGWINIGTHDQ